MEPKLEQQLVHLFENFIRQIVKDEQQLLINGLYSYNGTITQINSSIQPIISSKIGWLKSENTLLLLYNLLISHGDISCDFENFKIHFIGNNGSIETIKWLTQTNKLAYLFNQLMENEFIPKNDTPHQLLKEHFINNEGEKLKNGTLRTSLINVRNNSKSSNIVGIIINKLIKNQT